MGLYVCVLVATTEHSVIVTMTTAHRTPVRTEEYARLANYLGVKEKEREREK